MEFPARPSVDATPALAASKVISATPTVVKSCSGWIDSSAPSGTYYVQLIDAQAAVTGGLAIVSLAPPLKVVHAAGVDDYFSFESAIPVGGLIADHGVVVQLSTTLGTGTLAGSYMVAGGAR